MGKNNGIIQSLYELVKDAIEILKIEIVEVKDEVKSVLVKTISLDLERLIRLYEDENAPTELAIIAMSAVSVGAEIVSLLEAIDEMHVPTKVMFSDYVKSCYNAMTVADEFGKDPINGDGYQLFAIFPYNEKDDSVVAISYFDELSANNEKQYKFVLNDQPLLIAAKSNTITIGVVRFDSNDEPKDDSEIKLTLKAITKGADTFMIFDNSKGELCYERAMESKKFKK